MNVLAVLQHVAEPCCSVDSFIILNQNVLQLLMMTTCQTAMMMRTLTCLVR